MNKLLFLCTGNYYRSRFAEIYFNWHAATRSLNWKATSRGLELHPDNIGHMSRHTVQHLTGLGVPLDEYLRLPQAAIAQDFEDANHVVAVKATEHRPLITNSFPTYLDRVEFWEVHDLDCAGPEVAIPHLEREVMGLLKRLSSSKRV